MCEQLAVFAQCLIFEDAANPKPFLSLHSSSPPPHPCRILSERDWYEFPERWGMFEVGFSSLFLCWITRCQRGSAPRPTQADRQAILCTWTRGGGVLLDYYCAQEKLAIGNRATGPELNIWTSWRWKGLKRGVEKTCGQSESWKATELVGAAGVCCLSTAL